MTIVLNGIPIRGLQNKYTQSKSITKSELQFLHQLASTQIAKLGNDACKIIGTKTMTINKTMSSQTEWEIQIETMHGKSLAPKQRTIDKIYASHFLFVAISLSQSRGHGFETDSALSQFKPLSLFGGGACLLGVDWGGLGLNPLQFKFEQEGI